MQSTFGCRTLRERSFGSASWRISPLTGLRWALAPKKLRSFFAVTIYC